jgi:hypothetical protein
MKLYRLIREILLTYRGSGRALERAAGARASHLIRHGPYFVVSDVIISFLIGGIGFLMIINAVARVFNTLALVFICLPHL